MSTTVPPAALPTSPSNQSTQSVESTDSTTALLPITPTSTPPVERIFVDTSDSHAVHVTLDEEVATYFQDKTTISSDDRLSNIYIFLLVISIGLTGFLNLGEFILKWKPLNEYTLPCVMGFLIIQVLMYLLGYFNGGKLFYSAPFNPISCTSPSSTTLYRLSVYTAHKAYNTAYTVTMSLSPSNPPLTPVTRQLDIQDFFNVNGLFLRDDFYNALDGIYNELVTPLGKKTR